MSSRVVLNVGNVKHEIMRWCDACYFSSVRQSFFFPFLWATVSRGGGRWCCILTHKFPVSRLKSQPPPLKLTKHRSSARLGPLALSPLYIHIYSQGANGYRWLSSVFVAILLSPPPPSPPPGSYPGLKKSLIPALKSKFQLRGSRPKSQPQGSRSISQSQGLDESQNYFSL